MFPLGFIGKGRLRPDGVICFIAISLFLLLSARSLFSAMSLWIFNTDSMLIFLFGAFSSNERFSLREVSASRICIAGAVSSTILRFGVSIEGELKWINVVLLANELQKMDRHIFLIGWRLPLNNEINRLLVVVSLSDLLDVVIEANKKSKVEFQIKAE